MIIEKEEYYIKILKKYLNDEKRINHSISTANFMKEHSQKFGIDPEKAYIAGILHDIGKNFQTKEIIQLAQSYQNRKITQIKYFDFKIKHPFLLHGVAGAEIMISELNIVDEELLSSAIHHTTGGVNIPDIAKFTFICDFCEPIREYKESKKVHKILTVKKDFYKSYFLTYFYLIEDLLERKLEICLESIDGYNDALNLLKSQNK
jgi:predicted HD superfamily hydrolase involved in NAD metabolism